MSVHAWWPQSHHVLDLNQQECCGDPGAKWDLANGARVNLPREPEGVSRSEPAASPVAHRPKDDMAGNQPKDHSPDTTDDITGTNRDDITTNSDPTPGHHAGTSPSTYYDNDFVGDRAPSVDRSLVKSIEQHELDTVGRVAAQGHEVVFRLASDTAGVKTADAFIDSIEWEFKSPQGESLDSIYRVLREGRKQSPRIVLNLARSPLGTDEVLDAFTHAMDRYADIEKVVVITKDGQFIERIRG